MSPLPLWVCDLFYGIGAFLMLASLAFILFVAWDCRAQDRAERERAARRYNYAASRPEQKL